MSTNKRPIPGWRTMTGAQRRNAQYDRIWEDAKDVKTRFNASSRTETEQPATPDHLPVVAESREYLMSEIRHNLARIAELEAALQAAMTTLRYMRDIDTEHWDEHATPEICTAWDKARSALNSTTKGD